MTVMKERAIDMVSRMPEQKLYYVIQLLESVECLSENMIKGAKTPAQKPWKIYSDSANGAM